MAAIGQKDHWRDVLIAKSEAISDFWQVTLAYCGRTAEIVLFICMVISIIQMAPGLHMWDWLSGGNLIVQMITLDVAGFGLNSMARYVRRGGDEETAKKAETVGNALITIMIISLLSVTGKLMLDQIIKSHGGDPTEVDNYIGYFDDILILTRVGASVYYGKVIHALHEAKQYIIAQKQESADTLQETILQLQQSLRDERANSTSLKRDLQSAKDDYRQQLEAMQQSQSAINSTTELQNSSVQVLQNSLQNMQSRMDLQSAKIDELTQKLQISERSLQSTEQKLQSANLQNTRLQDDLKSATQSAKTQAAQQKSAEAKSADNVTDLQSAKDKLASRAKVPNEEIMKYKNAHPNLTNGQVADDLQISVRKVQDAVSWYKSLQTANPDEAAL